MAFAKNRTIALLEGRGFDKKFPLRGESRASIQLRYYFARPVPVGRTVMSWSGSDRGENNGAHVGRYLPVNGGRRALLGYLFDGNGERVKRRRASNVRTGTRRQQVCVWVWMCPSAKPWSAAATAAWWWIRARDSPCIVRLLSTIVRPVGCCCCCSAASGSGDDRID